jgi:hypothetical protein
MSMTLSRGQTSFRPRSSSFTSSLFSFPFIGPSLTGFFLRKFDYSLDSLFCSIFLGLLYQRQIVCLPPFCFQIIGFRRSVRALELVSDDGSTDQDVTPDSKLKIPPSLSASGSSLESESLGLCLSEIWGPSDESIFSWTP